MTMGTGRDADRNFDDAADTNAEEATLSGEEWPVAEHYRVEPSEKRADDEDMLVLQQVPATEPAPVRRFPPEFGTGALAALIGILLLVALIPAGIWLASRTGDDSEATAGTETPGTTTQPTTTEAPATTTPKARTVPDVTGRTLPQARRLLEDAELRSRFRRVDSDRPQNVVLSQAPEPGTESEARSIVVLTVSGGPGRIAVPDVEGLQAREAVSSLRQAGFESRNLPVPSEEPAGTVVGQSPAAGEVVAKGTVIALQVATARTSPKTSEPVTVRLPSLVGLRSADARSRLRALGLRSTQRPVESPRPAGEVVSQSPAAGAELREGGTVTLGVSSGPASLTVPDVVGMEEAAAVQQLEAAGFEVRVVDEPTTEATEDGIVRTQSPAAGASSREGATVTITVARFS